MSIDIYSSFFVQVVLFALLALVLLISAMSLFIKPAKRTIRASLVDDKTGHIIDICQAETSIGRAKACDLVISDASVSRFHAVLSKRKNGWIIFDTHSTAGVRVNGNQIEKKELLNDGDAIVFGKTKYIFYSTAVTTRQQVVPKTRQSSQRSQTTKHKKPINTDTKNDKTVRYEKNTGARNRKQ